MSRECSFHTDAVLPVSTCRRCVGVCEGGRQVERGNTYQVDKRSFNDDEVVLAIQYGLRIRDRVQDFG